MTPEQEAAIAAARARRMQAAPQFTPEQQAALDAARARRSAPSQPSADALARAADADAKALAMMQGGEQPGMVEDVAKSLASGVARGAAGLLDMPKQLVQMGPNLAAAGLERAGIVSPEFGAEMRRATDVFPMGTGSTARNALAGATGGATEYQPQTTPGEYAGTVGEFLPGAAAFGGMSPGNLLRYGVASGLGSEAAGQATEGTALEPYARVAGAVAAPMAVGAIGKAISPFAGADPERLKLAKVLDEFDVPVTAGQRTGSEALRRVEGGSYQGAAMGEKQAEAFTGAVLKTAGIDDATRATPEVLDEAAKRIGGVFDDVVKGIDVTPDPAVLTKMSDALGTYRSLTPSASAPPIFGEINREMIKASTGAPIPAATMKVWRSTLSKLTRSADTATREAAVEAMDAVDDAISGALTAAGRPEDIARLATARGQWRNLLAIQTAASRAGEGVAAGVLSPSNVRGAVAMQGRSAYALGKRGDLGALARAGEGVIKPLATVSSGGVRSIRGLPEMLGAGAGGSLGGPVGAMAGAAAPGLLREAAMLPFVQNYLANQAVNMPIVGGFARGVAAPAYNALSGR